MGNKKDGFGLIDSARKSDIALKEGAWLIADAHYAHYNEAFYDFLSRIKTEDLPPQIVFMGDIFDLFFPNAQNSIQPNRKMADLLQQIARQCEVIYLEGNHDFGLNAFFAGRIRVIPRSRQPLMAGFGKKRIALHHGDLLQGVCYELYTALIRNPFVDNILNGVDTLTNGAVINRLERYNRNKKPCYKIENFEEMARRRLDVLMQRYGFDFWIEGHFHQNIRFEYGDVSYFNLPAFVCAKTYTVTRFDGETIRFEERMAT